MPVQPDHVTLAPLIDTVCGVITIQFLDSGAYLRLEPDGTVQQVITDAKPTSEEVTLAVDALRGAGEATRAAGLASWAAAA